MPAPDQEALDWQIGVWNRISNVYLREIDQRFAPVTQAVMKRARLAEGEMVLDLGTGTGALAEQAAIEVGKDGQVLGVDISQEMLTKAEKNMVAKGLGNVVLKNGRGESIPADDHTFDVILSSLSLMYVIDRAAAVKEISRVLRPGGRLIASVWGGPDQCDIVLFQQTAGRFAGPPPVPGVGPGALADPTSFLSQLGEVGIEARVEDEFLGFDFPNFSSAWEALALVTTAHLPQHQQNEARKTVMEVMYPNGDMPRHFNNLTRFILGRTI